ncbi:MAG: hypothetical protein JKY56_14180, partial [Kofleriaceae bacterium]|nr:hypothetical protein [Kofleriaceae bacterium]
MRIPGLSTIPLILSLASCSLLFDEEGSTQSQSDGGDLADGPVGLADATSNDASPLIDGSSADATMAPCSENEVDCDPSENTQCRAECVTQFDQNGSYTAESGCNTLMIAAWGAGGGSGMSVLNGTFALNMDAAAGGYVYTNYALSGTGPHQFSVFVGTAGDNANNFGAGGIAGAFGAGAGGAANGVNAGGGGGGGGFSGVFKGSQALPTSMADAVAIAGGGGGSGGNTTTSTRVRGGAGGGRTGQNGGGITGDFTQPPSLGGGMANNKLGALAGDDGADMAIEMGTGNGGGG